MPNSGRWFGGDYGSVFGPPDARGARLDSKQWRSGVRGVARLFNYSLAAGGMMDPLQTHSEIVKVPTYDSAIGLSGWHDGDEHVSVHVVGREVIVSANPQGLRGLARELLSLAQENVPAGNEVYLMSEGQAPSLANGSASLRLVRQQD